MRIPGVASAKYVPLAVTIGCVSPLNTVYSSYWHIATESIIYVAYIELGVVNLLI